MNSADILEDICQRRRSIRKFDETHLVPIDVIERSLHRAILSPNSSNMQLWEFVWVQSEEMRRKMVPLCLGQQAAKTAGHLVAFVTRGDLWRSRADWNLAQMPPAASEQDEKRVDMMRKYYGTLMPLVYRTDFLGLNSLLRWLVTSVAGLFRPFMRIAGRGDQRVILHKSCALAAQTFMLSIAAEGYDSCPMEGFDRRRVARALDLPAGAEVCMIVAVGKGTAAGIYGERMRVPAEEVIRIV